MIIAASQPARARSTTSCGAPIDRAFETSECPHTQAETDRISGAMKKLMPAMHMTIIALERIDSYS